MFKKKTNKLKLHVGCGEVYLKDYVNVDVVGDLAADNQELAAEKTTDLNNYYKRQFSHKLEGLDKNGRNVVDVRADIRKLDMFDNGTVDEILAVNVIDHIGLNELSQVIARWRSLLKPEGQLIIDVGDAKLNAKAVLDANSREELEWALRYVYCHGRDEHDSHHWGYTSEYLKDLMQDWGFKEVWSRDDFIIHAYPNFQSCFQKIN
jgi:predicted SAM-dependent methyltransferase